jgi:hypothetical protein
MSLRHLAREPLVDKAIECNLTLQSSGNQHLKRGQIMWLIGETVEANYLEFWPKDASKQTISLSLEGVPDKVAHNLKQTLNEFKIFPVKETS